MRTRESRRLPGGYEGLVDGRKLRLGLVVLLGVAGLLTVWAAGPVLAAPGDTTRVSVSSSGQEGNGGSTDPIITADGHLVVFRSRASNLVAGDSNGFVDVFVHDRDNGSTSRVSVGSGGIEANGDSSQLSVSTDGRHVGFSSQASNLVPDDTNAAGDVFVRDLTTGLTSRVSVSSSGEQADSDSFASYGGAVSADGRHVAFVSFASNLVAADTNGTIDAFVHDLVTGETTRVSVDSTQLEANESSGNAAISEDGRYVVFESFASNLVPGDSNNSVDVFVHDLGTGETSRVSVDSSGAGGNSDSYGISITADGRYVAFMSAASNLIGADTNAVEDVFVHDRVTGATERISLSSAGDEGNDHSTDADISPDGRYVGFHSLASNLVAGDTNAIEDVFVHDRITGATTRVSVSGAGGQGNGDSSFPSLSATGGYLAFQSEATNLVSGDGNGVEDVFVHQFLADPATPPSPPPPPPPPSGGETVGLVDPASGVWYLRDGFGRVSSFFYGDPGDVPFMGDWNCDGVDTPGLFRLSDAFAYLRNANSQGIANIRFFFGNPSDIPLAGDFDGDGCDTLSLYRPSEQRFYIINELGANNGGLGPAEFSFLFGNPGDKPFVGDFDGDGIDEVGLHRESTGFVYYRNTLDTGVASNDFFFGDPGDRFVAGDWGMVDGTDTPGMFRPGNNTFYFRHTNTQGNADNQFAFGDPSYLPVAGVFGLER